MKVLQNKGSFQIKCAILDETSFHGIDGIVQCQNAFVCKEFSLLIEFDGFDELLPCNVVALNIK